MPCHPLVVSNAISPSASPTAGSPTPSVDRHHETSVDFIATSGPCENLRTSSTLLPDQVSLASLPLSTIIGPLLRLPSNAHFARRHNHLCTASSSTTSSLTSVAVATLGHHPQRSSDPWLRPERDKDNPELDQRRASTMTARLSLSMHSISSTPYSERQHAVQ
uniref:Uncharacterized protein n=1 Tax=Anopheles funestus TaxID=62324 RepID=A0A182RVG1_ANOFN